MLGPRRGASAPARTQVGQRVQEGAELTPVPRQVVAVRGATDELETNAVGIFEEGGVVVRTVFRVGLRLRAGDPPLSKSRDRRVDIRSGWKLQAQVEGLK